MKKISRINLILIAILIFTSLARLFMFAYPNAYVFDEVYHGFTAKEYVKGSKAAWDPWATPPKGVAYEWTHPPLAKEMMAASLITFNTMDPWGWRLPGIILGIISVYLVYLLAITWFNNSTIGLISAFIFSIDGLNFVQSRTGMNDIYLVTFLLASIILFFRKKFLFSAIFLGFALASKWTALYLIPVLLIFSIIKLKPPKICYFIFIPFIIYLITYSPYFKLGYNLINFIQLQQQMWWYHTNLKATHDYASPWWSWPLNLYPVWYFVDYKGDKIANIFASGNPIVFWSGFAAILISLWEILTKNIAIIRQKLEKGYRNLFRYFINMDHRKIGLELSIFFYALFFLPWAFSPRIMFLYHYSPSVPFLSIALGYQLNSFMKNNKISVFILLVSMLIGFILIYPFLVGIPLPKSFVKLFFLTNITKDPFNL